MKRINFIKHKGFNWAETLLCLYVVLLPIMLVPSFPVIGRKIQYSDLLFPVLFVMLLFGLLSKRVKLVKTSIYIPISFYLVMHILSIFNSNNIFRSLLEIIGVIYLAAIFFIALNLISNRMTLRNIMISWMLGLGIVIICGITGIISVNILKTTHSLFMLNYQEPIRYHLMHSVISRVISTLRSPDMLMSYLVVSSGLLIAFYKSTKQKLIKGFIICLLGLSFFITLFTLSRGIVAFLICFFISSLISANKNGIALVIIRYFFVVIITLFFAVFIILTIWEPSEIYVSDTGIPMERNLSIDFHRTTRSYFYKYAFSMIMEHPFIGVGSGTFNNALAEYYYKDDARDPYFSNYVAFDPHCAYLGLAAEIGLIGLLLFLVSVILFLKSMFGILNNARTPPYVSNFALGIIASVIGILVQGLAMDIHNLRHLWLIMGVGISLRNINTRDE